MEKSIEELLKEANEENSSQEAIAEEKTKSVLKWTGGKSRLISSIIPRFINPQVLKSGSVYIEPFAGSCSVAFAVNHNRMILNDKNIKLINFFTQTKTRPEKLFRKISKLVKEYEKCNGLDEQEKFFYKIRETYNSLVLSSNGNGLTHASFFWFLNKTCFNGMYRETSNGKFNIPFGKRDCPKPCLKDFLNVSAILKNCHLYGKPFETICSMAKPDDMVYLDPPYIPVSITSSFSGYLRYGFDLNDHKKLCKIMQGLSDNNVRVVMSNSDCELTRQTYGGLRDFSFHHVETTRLISGHAKGRGKIKEVVITNMEKFKNE